jgi:hypothetical protein
MRVAVMNNLSELTVVPRGFSIAFLQQRRHVVVLEIERVMLTA